MNSSLDYRLHVGDVEPWLALLSRKGSGSMDIAGRAQGNLSDLETSGTYGSRRFNSNGMAVKNGSVGYSLRGSKEQFFPEGTINATVTDLDAGLALRRYRGKREVIATTAIGRLTLAAQDSQNRKHNVAGTVDFSNDALVAHLNQASLAAPDGAWKLFVRRQ